MPNVSVLSVGYMIIFRAVWWFWAVFYPQFVGSFLPLFSKFTRRLEQGAESKEYWDTDSHSIDTDAGSRSKPSGEEQTGKQSPFDTQIR